MNSFFDKNYRTPTWLKRKLSRRTALKSALGATTIAAMPSFVNAKAEQSASQLAQLVKTDPWMTLEQVLAHLLPSSSTGPGAKEIRALAYFHNLVHEQPIEQAEKDFIFKGIGWLNGYSQSQVQKNFVELTNEDKETMLRAISRSRAGENWLNTLINYLYEAMLSPSAYGGNPDGIGWQWLEHQAGFPLPPQGKRYYELPGTHQISVNNMPVEEKTKS